MNYKQKIFRLVITAFFVLANNNEANCQNIVQDSIVWENDTPKYFRNEFIIKFNPIFVDTQIINNLNIQTGLLSEFINPLLLQAIIDSGYFNNHLAGLRIKKIHSFLTSNVKYSISRLGDTIQMPAYWSTFLLYWDENHLPNYDSALVTLKMLYPYIEYVHPNYVIGINTFTSDPLWKAGKQGGLDNTSNYNGMNINIDPAWAYSTGMNNCRVGIFDTGINWFHDDFSENGSNSYLNSRIKGGYNCILGRRWGPNYPTYTDDNGHGTGVASIIGAIRNNDIGIAGIAGGNYLAPGFEGASLWDFKIFNSTATFDRLSSAIGIITEASSEFNGNYGYSINIMNHSWGISLSDAGSDAESLKESVRWANRNNVAFVVGSGNTGNKNVYYPASYKDEWVMKVGGSNSYNGQWWVPSTYDNNLDFVAPAQSELYDFMDNFSNSNFNNGLSGTSFSSPHVSGVSALMISYIKNNGLAPNMLAPEDLEVLLETYASDIQTTGYDIYSGYGRINAGMTLTMMELPFYEIKHYNSIINNNSANLIESNITINLNENKAGITAGTYLGDVYKIRSSINVSQPIGRTILNIWPRVSSSTLYGYGYQPLLPEINPNLVSWNQSIATIDGYIYHIKSEASSGKNINKWLPETGLNGNSTFAISVYSHSLWSNKIQETKNESKLKIYPNPSKNGIFKIALSEEYIDEISVYNTVGEPVLKLLKNDIIKTINGDYIELNLSTLSSGVYLIQIYSNSALFTKKIII